MRLSLILFSTSILVSVWLTAFSKETREFFRGGDSLVVIDEGGPEQFLTKKDAIRIQEWVNSETFDDLAAELSDDEPILFYSTYHITNAGNSDVSNGQVEFDEGFSIQGLIAARVRAPLPNKPIGQIEPRRFAWNEFEEASEGKFSFDVRLLKPGETVSIQVIADEFGAVTPTFRAADVKTLPRLRYTIEQLYQDDPFDWIGFLRILSVFALTGSAFYLGRNFEELRELDWKSILRIRSENVVEDDD